MKIIIKRNDQSPEHTIDMKDVDHAYAIRDAFKSAMVIDGCTTELINDVFNETPCQNAKKSTHLE